MIEPFCRIWMADSGTSYDLKYEEYERLAVMLENPHEAGPAYVRVTAMDGDELLLNLWGIETLLMMTEQGFRNFYGRENQLEELRKELKNEW